MDLRISSLVQSLGAKKYFLRFQTMTNTYVFGWNPSSFVHIRNRWEHKLTGNLTPVEIWRGHKPSVRQLKIFRSLTFVHVHKVNRNKLQLRGKLKILAGYGQSTKGYRIFISKELQ
ncbi:retrovirus-related Pol polyprotein from transposon TNT 1-94 [Caerostris extrusa]|uniref:Retrovirus-related Pol polyprotein from transposon TNT 1-94 n=1 Tax=Caerostris extrusa TaxID=172846 RepID=A0AAV4M6Q7_CAEEX|nr:retrovirus-related Pol polyprotein from transposon TNT 1-94 [Caerostris extrusa]